MDNKKIIKIVPRTAKELAELVVREKRKIQRAYREACNVRFGG